MVLKVCWHLRLKIYILLAYFLLYVYVTASARSKDPLDMELHLLKYYSVYQPRDKTGNVLTSELIISTLKPRLGKFSMVFSSVFSILFLACSVSVRKERYCLEMLRDCFYWPFRSSRETWWRFLPQNNHMVPFETTTTKTYSYKLKTDSRCWILWPPWLVIATDGIFR